MKKLYFIIAFFIFCCILIIFKFGGYLGAGKYYLYDDGKMKIKSKTNEYFMIGEIFDYDYSDKCIIAKRIPAFYFDCPDSAITRYLDKIQYILIDKKSDKIFYSYDEKKFFNFVEKYDKELFLSKSSSQRMASKIEYYKEHDKIIKDHKEYLNSSCEDDFMLNQINNNMVEIE